MRQAADRIGFDKVTGLHSTTSFDKPGLKGSIQLVLSCVVKSNHLAFGLAYMHYITFPPDSLLVSYLKVEIIECLSVER